MKNIGTGGGGAEWRAGWTSVLVASLGISLSTAHIYSQGLFMAPLHQAFGWSRAEITTGPFLLSVISAVGIVFSGLLVDRFGARRVVMPGLVLYTLTMATLIFTSASIWQWYASWSLVALAMPLVTPAVWTSSIVARCSVSRGVALAVALAGTGLSSTVSPVIIERLIETHGWRAGYSFFPLVSALIIFPLALTIFDRSPRLVESAASVAHAKASEQPLLESVRSPTFAWLLMASLLFAFGLMALMAHFVPIVTEKGLSRPIAAAAIGVVGLCSIAGRLTTGFLLDRFNSSVVAGVAFLLPLVPVSMLLGFHGTSATAFGAAMVLGASLGAEVDIIAYLTAHHFGLRRYGTFVGMIQGTTALAVGGGPLVGGIIYDTTGNYDMLLWGCIPLFLAGAGAILMLGRLPVRPSHLPEILEEVLVN